MTILEPETVVVKALTGGRPKTLFKGTWEGLI